MFFVKDGAPLNQREADPIRERLIDWILQNAESSLRELPVSPDRPAPDVPLLRTLLTNFAFFYVHWVDRVAFVELGERRDKFIDGLHDEFIPRLAAKHYDRMPPNLRATLEQHLSEQLNDFVVGAAQYQIAPSPSVPVTESLVYMFARTVALELERPGDPVAIAQTAAILASRLNEETARDLVRLAGAIPSSEQRQAPEVGRPDTATGEQVAEELYQKMHVLAREDKIDELLAREDRARERRKRYTGPIIVAALVLVAIVNGMCAGN